MVKGKVSQIIEGLVGIGISDAMYFTILHSVAARVSACEKKIAILCYKGKNGYHVA